MNRNKHLIILVSFITAAFLAAVIFVVSGIYPGSERTLLIFDMKEQFVSFYAYMSRVRRLSDLKYTFEGSLGTPLAGLIAYYLASPLSFIYLFFDVVHLPDAIVLVDILKCGFIAASFAYFSYFKGVKEPVKVLILSLCYSLSSSAVTFFILPMYLDTLFWLPLIAVALEKLFMEGKKKKRIIRGLIYSLLLLLCILTHYYSAYMVCLFLILYAAYILTSVSSGKNLTIKDFAVRYISFVFYSLVSSGLALVILLPAFKELIQGKVYDSGVYSNGGIIVAGPLVILKQFLCGSFGGLYSEGGPAIYCTLICLGLAGFALYKMKSNRAELWISLIIFAIFICSFMFRPMYRVWHMFRDPVAYPHRFAFLFVFFVMVLACEGIKYIKIKNSIFGACLVLVSGLLIFNGYRQINMDLKTLPSATRSDYRLFIDTTADLVYEAQESSDVFCRISKDYEFTSSDTMLLGYNGLDYFSSSYDPEMLRFYKELGLLQYHYKACDEGTTILTDMLFGIDYMIHKGHADFGYDYITSNGFATLSSNPYSLGLGYLISGSEPSFANDPFANQNEFVNGLLGREENFLEELDYTEVITEITGLAPELDDNGEYVKRQQINREITFTAPAGKNVYLNFELLNESDLDYETKSESDLIVVTIDDRVIAVFTGYQKAYNIRLGYFEEDTEISVNIEGTDDYREVFLYSMDMDRFEAVYDELSESKLSVNSVSGDRIEGSVSTQKDGKALLLTIPYSDDIEVFIDGEKAHTDRYAGALLMVPDIETGEHNVVIKL